MGASCRSRVRGIYKVPMYTVDSSADVPSLRGKHVLRIANTMFSLRVYLRTILRIFNEFITGISIAYTYY